MRSRRIPARHRSVVHPRSLYSGDFAIGFYLSARSTQRLSQWLGTDDCAGVLHTVCSPTPDSCCLKDEMKPATNDDLFLLHQGTDSTGAGYPAKMSLR